MDKKTEAFANAIRTLVPLNGLSAQYQNEIINQAKILELRRRQHVFKQGARDDYAFYLLEGTVELLHDKELVKEVTGGTEAARYALSQLQPRQMAAKAKTPAKLVRIDRLLVDRLLTVEEVAQDGEMQVAEIESEDSGDWMTRLLQSELFSRIPAANIQRIFSTMCSLEVEAGQVVVEQGGPGDYYYFIQRGRCEVTRKASPDAEPIKLAELCDGDTFGEEALVADATRNASVIMLSDGELMRLTKEDFVDLIKKPLLESVTHAKATTLVKSGAQWLDVRFPDEFQEACIDGAINVPLNVLRAKLDLLDPAKAYVVYCDTGSRSSVAAFLLSQRGYDVFFLIGGLIEAPDAIPRQSQKESAADAPRAKRKSKAAATKSKKKTKKDGKRTKGDKTQRPSYWVLLPPGQPRCGNPSDETVGIGKRRQ